MARQLPILWLCLPHGIETVACRSSCSLGSSRSRWEAMRHGLPWREVMRAVTSVNSAAVAASVRAFREGESSGAAASLAGASVTTVSLTGSTADEASSRTWALIPTATSTTWITGTIRTTRTTRTPAATRTAATATCLHTPTLNTASGRTVRRERSCDEFRARERSRAWRRTRPPFGAMIETPGAAARRRHDRPRAAVSRRLQAEASIIWNPQRRPSGKTCSSLLLPRSMGRAGESDSHWRPRCEPGRRARSRGIHAIIRRATLG